MRSITLLSLALTFAAESLSHTLPRVEADRIVVRKADRILTLYWHGAKLKSYRVALGGRPEGPKSALGDQRTPEGLYTVTKRTKKTDFHAALEVSYPNAADLARARAARVSPGGGIEIHGLHDGFEWLGSAHAILDWTDGCIAVTNAEIDEIVAAVPNGTPLEILP
jgi:murein L,D-transpeptidase YafK